MLEDPTRLAVLYREHFPLLAGLAVKHLPDQGCSQAEDVVQAAFALLEAGDRVRATDDAGTPAYLRQTVVNLARDTGRRETVAARQCHEIAQPLSTVTTAEHDALARLLGRDLIAALVALAARQRAAVVWRHFFDWSEADTAAAMGCATGTVKAYASRGLATADAAGTRPRPGRPPAPRRAPSSTGHRTAASPGTPASTPPSILHQAE
jgi:RNA polymerase sigma factor (sigma-70 family)